MAKTGKNNLYQKMRALIQRVSGASVAVDGEIVGKIGAGLCVFLGVGHDDTEKDAEWMADKLINLRIFEDDAEKMNLSLRDVDGEMLIISQFTLYGDCRAGRRPSFVNAALPAKAEPLYNAFIDIVERKGILTASGVFGADMKVSILNDGPVTFMIDSPHP